MSTVLLANHIDETKVHTLTEVLKNVQALVPMLRNSAEETEKNRQVPDSHIEALTKAGVFRLTLPRSQGGFEANVEFQNKVLKEISRGCPSTGWVSTLITTMNWMIALFPDQAQREVFATPDVRVASVFAPTGKATPQDGGVIVNGRWSWNTGSANAHWAMLAAMVENPDGTPAPYYLMIPYSELGFEDDWFASGLAGTGSRTTTAKNVYVPAHRMISIADMNNGIVRDSTLAATNPYFQRTLAPVFHATSGGALAGIAEGAMDVFLERLPGKRITYTDYSSQLEAPITHHQLGEATLQLFSANAHIDEASRLVDQSMHTELTLRQRALIKGHIGHAAKLARDTVAILFQASGTSSIHSQFHIQRYHRDIQALSLHAALLPTTNTEVLGRVLVGLKPNTTLI